MLLGRRGLDQAPHRVHAVRVHEDGCGRTWYTTQCGRQLSPITHTATQTVSCWGDQVWEGTAVTCRQCQKVARRHRRPDDDSLPEERRGGGGGSAPGG